MVKVQFVKMHGCGNDFIMMEGFSAALPQDMAALAVRLCDRHFGIGADGILALYPAEGYDFEMRIFQPDGSEAEMCGNGIRCAAIYALMCGITDKRELAVKTGAGLIRPTVSEDMRQVRVDMGAPRLAAGQIPCRLGGDTVLEQPLAVAGQEFRISAVSMGNPHAVIFIDRAVADYPVTEYGPQIETDAVFPARTNVEFAEVLDERHIRVRVWERGVGETLACGTGACAAGVAAMLTGRAADEVDIILPGGTLHISWQPGQSVFMAGAAECVFRGEVEL